VGTGTEGTATCSSTRHESGTLFSLHLKNEDPREVMTTFSRLLVNFSPPFTLQNLKIQSIFECGCEFFLKCIKIIFFYFFKFIFYINALKEIFKNIKIIIIIILKKTLDILVTCTKYP